MSAAWLVCGLVPAKHMLCSMPFKCCLTHRLTQTCIQDHDCTLHIYICYACVHLTIGMNKLKRPQFELRYGLYRSIVVTKPAVPKSVANKVNITCSGPLPRTN